MQIKINEDADKCCLCIPIDTGVKIVGIFCIFNMINVVRAVLWCLTFDIILTIIVGVLGAPLFYSGLLFVKYFRNDCSETRADLQKACVFVVFANIATAVWFLIYFFVLYSGSNSGSYMSAVYSGYVGPYVFQSVIYLYYAGVCKRYAKQ